MVDAGRSVDDSCHYSNEDRRDLQVGNTLEEVEDVSFFVSPVFLQAIFEPAGF